MQATFDTDHFPRIVSLDYYQLTVEWPCPVIFLLVRDWRVYLSEDDRARLIRPLEPRLANTRSTEAVEERRSVLAADWLVRVNAPAWLRLAKLDSHADALEALPEITSLAQIPSIRGLIGAAKEDSEAARAEAGHGYTTAIHQVFKNVPRAVGMSAAMAAAIVAANDTVWETARLAARNAVWLAAKNAARAATLTHPGREAARDARRKHVEERERFAAMAVDDVDRNDEREVLSAAEAAEQAALAPVMAAAKIAARDDLQPTVERLQQSLLDLVDRMIEVRDARAAGGPMPRPPAVVETKKSVIAGIVSRLVGG